MRLLRDAPTFLTFEQIRDEVARFTYRPGWHLSAFDDPFEGPCFYVVADVPNGYRPEETVELRIRSNIPPIPDPEYLAVWVWWRLDLIERHETREFLHRDGKPWSDPHDPIEPGGKDVTAEPERHTLADGLAHETRWRIWWAGRHDPKAFCPAHGEHRCRTCAQSGGRAGRRVVGRLCEDCTQFGTTGMHWDTCPNRVPEQAPDWWSPDPAWSVEGTEDRPA